MTTHALLSLLRGACPRAEHVPCLWGGRAGLVALARVALMRLAEVADSPAPEAEVALEARRLRRIFTEGVRAAPLRQPSLEPSGLDAALGLAGPSGRLGQEPPPAQQRLDAG